MIWPGPPELIACCVVSAARSCSRRASSAAAAAAISASSFACRAATACSTSACFALSVASLASSWSAISCCCCSSRSRSACWDLSCRSPPPASHHVVVGLVRLIEELLPADGVDGVLGVDQRLERAAGVGVGEQRGAAGRTCGDPRPWPSPPRSTPRGRRCARASPRACVRRRERRRGVVGRLAGVGEYLARGASRSSFVAAPGREDGHAHAQRRQEPGGGDDGESGSYSRGCAPGDQGTLPAASFASGLELVRRGVDPRSTRRTHAEVHAAGPAVRLRGPRAAPLGARSSSCTTASTTQAYVDGANTTFEKLDEARESGDFGTINQLEKNLAFHLSGHVLHSLFWKNMAPDGGGEPDGELAAAIDEQSSGHSTRSRRS